MHPMHGHDAGHPRRRHHHPRHPGHPGHPGPHEGFPPHRRGGRGRAPRGDVRAAILLLLAEQPMHGYQLMQTIADRSGGAWTPSPGAVYPALSQLEDEGLVTLTVESGRKLVTLTEAGREHVESRREGWSDPFGAAAGPRPGAELRGLLEQLHGAAREVARTGNEAQIAAAATILGDARRALYLLLAEGPGTTGA
jgi:DNA-binding PadR family transcriptional regulator